MNALGFEPRTFRLKAEHSTILSYAFKKNIGLIGFEPISSEPKSDVFPKLNYILRNAKDKNRTCN